MMYPVKTVPDRAHREDEYLGTKYKFWYFDAADRRVLFKRGRVNEDWSEKVAAEVARALHIPAADVDLAECDGERGIVSPTLLDRGEHMHHGNELLVELDPAYPHGDRYRVAQHTISAVFSALVRNRTQPSRGHSHPWTGYAAEDQFVGYLLLDALIGNTDRHHENWAVLQHGSERYLAPTYDHASSLGRNETEPRIEARLGDTDPRMTVAKYIAKGKSAFYHPGDTAPMTPAEAFAWAAEARPDAARHWGGRLEATSADTFEAIVGQIPADRISEPHRRFTLAILGENRERLMQIIGRLSS